MLLVIADLFQSLLNSTRAAVMGAVLAILARLAGGTVVVTGASPSEWGGGQNNQRTGKGECSRFHNYYNLSVSNPPS